MLLRFEIRAPRSSNWSLNFALCDPCPTKLREGWAKFPSEYLGKSSALVMHGLNFRCFASLQNHSAAKTTAAGRKLRQPFTLFDPPPTVKLGGGWSLSQFFVQDVGPNHWCTFDGAPSGRLESGRQTISRVIYMYKISHSCRGQPNNDRDIDDILEVSPVALLLSLLSALAAIMR